MSSPANNDAALREVLRRSHEWHHPERDLPEGRECLSCEAIDELDTLLASLAATAERADEAERMIALCKTLLRQFQHAGDEPLDETVTVALDSFAFQKHRSENVDAALADTEQENNG